jgi:hypothetical protein
LAYEPIAPGHARVIKKALLTDVDDKGPAAALIRKLDAATRPSVVLDAAIDLLEESFKMQRALCAALNDSFPSHPLKRQGLPQGERSEHNGMLRAALGCLEARLQLVISKNSLGKPKDQSGDPFARHYRVLLGCYPHAKGNSAVKEKVPSRTETVDLVETFSSIWARPSVPTDANRSRSKQQSPATSNRPLDGCEKEWLTKMYYVTLFVLDRSKSDGLGPLVLAGLTFKHKLPLFGGDVRNQVLRAVDLHSRQKAREPYEAKATERNR